MYMKKRSSRKTRKAHRAHTSGKIQENYLVVVRSWMLLVMFALMLGLGAVVGTYFNHQSALDTPQVAGAQTDAR